MPRLFLSTMLLCGSILFSCAGQRKVNPDHRPVATGRYQSDVNAITGPEGISRITRSVRKVYSVATYTTWQFRREDRITAYHMQQGTYRKHAWGVITTSETVFGTGTVLTMRNSRVAVLTCAHVVTAPDTLIGYFEPEGEDPIRYVQRFSLLDRQENWVSGLSACGSFGVVAADMETDIALLGARCEGLRDTLDVFPCPAGRAMALEWGDGITVLGYPMGNLVLTRGMASPAVHRTEGEFFIDALLNKGYSGGVLLAAVQGNRGLELVGMVSSVQSTREEYLKPEPGHPRTPDWMPYTGEPFIGRSDHIHYGLNMVIPVERILSFLNVHRNDLLRSGFFPDSFFHTGP